MADPITTRRQLADAAVRAFLDGDDATRQHIVDELGARAEPQPPIAVTPLLVGVEAVQLVGDVPWEDVAAWCGGTIENYRDQRGDWYSYIAVSQAEGEPLKAWEHWWIVRYPGGETKVLRDPLMPLAAMYPSLWNKLMVAAHDGCPACVDDPNVGCRDRHEAEYETCRALKVVVEHLDLLPEPDAAAVFVPC